MSDEEQKTEVHLLTKLLRATDVNLEPILRSLTYGELKQIKERCEALRPSSHATFRIVELYRLVREFMAALERFAGGMLD